MIAIWLPLPQQRPPPKGSRSVGGGGCGGVPSRWWWRPQHARPSLRGIWCPPLPPRPPPTACACALTRPARAPLLLRPCATRARLARGAAGDWWERPQVGERPDVRLLFGWLVEGRVCGGAPRLDCRRLAGKSGFRGLSQSPGRGRQGRLWQLPRAATMAPLSPPPSHLGPLSHLIVPSLGVGPPCREGGGGRLHWRTSAAHPLPTPVFPHAWGRACGSGRPLRGMGSSGGRRPRTQ